MNKIKKFYLEEADGRWYLGGITSYGDGNIFILFILSFKRN